MNAMVEKITMSGEVLGELRGLMEARAQEIILSKEIIDEQKDLMKKQATEIIRLKKHVAALYAYKAEIGTLYGKGHEVTNWHLNGETEPLDNFLDEAETAYEGMISGELPSKDTYIPEEVFYTVAETAKILGYSQRSVMRFASEGKLTKRKVINRIVFLKEEVDRIRNNPRKSSI